MTDKMPRHDLRDSQRTEEAKAAEKKVGDSPFAGRETHPQDAPAEAPRSATKQ